VNLISKREKQLINGEKPLVRPLSSDEDKVDTALREVAEGKLISEIDFDAIARAEDAKTKWARHFSLRTIYGDDE
jgi:DNA-directed RNA polymerase subunit K/omega